MPQPALPLLRQILEGRLGLEELRSAAFDLGLDYEGLDTRPKLARELLLHLERRNQLERLTAWLTANRPDIDLETLAATAPAGDSAAGPVSLAPTNLPAQLTPFVGREKEMAEIEALLRSPATRLVTLLGPVGIGKTRLAQEM